MPDEFLRAEVGEAPSTGVRLCINDHMPGCFQTGLEVADEIFRGPETPTSVTVGIDVA